MKRRDLTPGLDYTLVYRPRGRKLDCVLEYLAEFNRYTTKGLLFNFGEQEKLIPFSKLGQYEIYLSKKQRVKQTALWSKNNKVELLAILPSFTPKDGAQAHRAHSMKRYLSAVAPQDPLQ